jgi:hypothetical protein
MRIAEKSRGPEGGTSTGNTHPNSNISSYKEGHQDSNLEAIITVCWRLHPRPPPPQKLNPSYIADTNFYKFLPPILLDISARVL